MTGRRDNVFRNENDFNNLKSACEEYNGPNCTRTQGEIAKTLNMSAANFGRHAKEHKNNNFPASYADAQAQGRGMGRPGGRGSVGGTISSGELLIFAENNIDTDDTGRGMESVLFSTFVDQFPGIDAVHYDIRRNAMRSVRRHIQRLRRERDEMAALAAEAPIDDDSSSSSDDDEDFS